MSRNTDYHAWTSKEISVIHKYIENARRPTSALGLLELSGELNLPYHAVRGAVVREMSHVKKVDSM